MAAYSKMVVKTREEAFVVAQAITGCGNFVKDEKKSENAGYPVYTSFGRDDFWVSDLNCRIEANTDGGKKTECIWIDALRDCSEFCFDDAFNVILECLYEIEDKISPAIRENTELKAAYTALYKTVGELSEIVKEKFPGSTLIEKYNL